MAVPAAAVTLIVTLADTALPAVATTRTVSAPSSSATPVTADGVLSPSSKLNSISLSKISKLAVFTSKKVVPVAVPENRIVSSASASVSDTGVTVDDVEARPTVSPLLIVTVVEAGETV